MVVSRFFIVIALCMCLVGCKDFFGEKTDTDFIEVPTYDNKTVAFVPIQPILRDFIRPIDIISGFDELLYVVDEGTNEIIALDQAGNVLSRYYLKGVKKVVQDRRLDLMAIADFDTVIQGNTYTLSAIYRLRMPLGDYRLSAAQVVKRIIHPFYFRTSFAAPDAQVRFRSIAVLADNSYYVVRNGNNNSTLQFGGPEDAILYFEASDIFVNFLPVNTETGVSIDYFKKPYGIVGLCQPPQSPFVSTSKDFYFSSVENLTALKVQRIKATETDNGTEFSLDTGQITGDTSKADNFLYVANRFVRPQGLTYSGDGTNYLFVSDSEKDSVYVFTNTGLEGVRPPASAESKKNIIVSFGGEGNGPTQFKEPTGLCFYNKMLYVCDAGNARILRFKLTTDF